MKRALLLIAVLSNYAWAGQIPDLEYGQDCLSAVKEVETKTGVVLEGGPTEYFLAHSEDLKTHIVFIACEETLLRTSLVIYKFPTLELAAQQYEKFRIQLTTKYGKPEIDGHALTSGLPAKNYVRGISAGMFSETSTYFVSWRQGAINTGLSINKDDEGFRLGYDITKFSSADEAIQP